MALKAFTAKNILLIGQCIAHKTVTDPGIENAAKVVVQRLEFDSFLNMYFPKQDNFYAYDPEQKCKDGDIVLIRRRPEKLTNFITHDLVKILYLFGDVTDPITGEKCFGNIYRKTMKLEKELYGVAKDGTGGFDYDSAPERGWQINKKDFTDRVGYQKFHDFQPGHPMHEDPGAT